MFPKENAAVARMSALAYHTIIESLANGFVYTQRAQQSKKTTHTHTHKHPYMVCSGNARFRFIVHFILFIWICGAHSVRSAYRLDIIRVTTKKRARHYQSAPDQTLHYR